MFNDDLLEILESLFADDEMDDDILVLNGPIIPFSLEPRCCDSSYVAYSTQ